MVDRRTFCAWSAFGSPLTGLPWPTAATAAPGWPGVMLAEEAPDGLDPAGYLVSEKLDGVRAVWDGTQLRHRSGHALVAPDWFTDGWPATPLDGELWLARGRFDRLSGIVRRHRPDDAAWRQVSYQVFDLPGEAGPFTERLARMNRVVARLQVPHVVALPQHRIANHEALTRWLDHVVRQGGEGLMLHLGQAPWRPGRQPTLLKLKMRHDAEAVVIGHQAGRGRLSGLVGALTVRDAQGHVFQLGSGLSDADRADPPPLGALVTYRYRGRTPQGLPRFATYLRRKAWP